MQLTITTDYAIRVLLSLGEYGKLKKATEISQEMKIPLSYLNKILRKLREGGMIGSIPGVNGGHFLKKTLDEITVLDIIKCIEPSIKINRCLEEDGFCSRNATKICAMRKYWSKMQMNWEQTFMSITLNDVIREAEVPQEKSDLSDEES